MKSFSTHRRIKAPLLSLLILHFSLAFASATVKESATVQKSRAKNLFIIVANGERYDDAFGHKIHLYTEKIWTELRPFGTICTKFYNTGLTCPIPAQASLLTGAWHVWENPLVDTIHPAFPTLFEYWKRIKADNNCYFAANKKQFAILAHSDQREYGRAYAPLFDAGFTGSSIDTSLRKAATEVIENAIYSKAVSHIFQHHPSFVFLNLDSGGAEEAYPHAHECRITDKEDGCEGEADQLNSYYESIILTDTIVYDLWNRIQRDEVYKDKSIFIFMSAHGRHTGDFRGYGDDCRGCRQLNFLIIGPGVKKDFISKTKRNLIDICPTVGALCAIPTPYAKGKIMKEILE